jgi:O-antigen/teichoic acid export membrane protein
MDKLIDESATTGTLEDMLSPDALSSRQLLLGTVARNSAFVLGLQVLLKVLAFLFNVYVVRRLGDVHFGRYSSVMAYVAVFAIFTDWGLAPYSMREMARNRDSTWWLLPNIIVIRLLLSLVIIIVAPLSALWLGKDSEIVVGIFIASLGLLFYSFQGPLDAALTARERLDQTSVLALVNQLVFWGLGTLLLISGMGFVGLLIASQSGIAVIALFSAWALFRLDRGHLRFSLRGWPQLVRAAFPFGVSGISYVFMQRFDTVLMSFLVPAAAVGWYNVPWTMINMVLLVAQSIAVAMYPSMVRSYVDDPDSLPLVVWQSLKYLLIVCLPVSVGGTILAKRIVIALYGETFAPSAPVLRVLLWALPSLFLLELLGRIADTLHLESPKAKANLCNAGITVALNLVLVPTLGILGAALALLAGRTIRLVQFWRLIGNERLVGERWGTILRDVLSAAIMGIAVYGLSAAPFLGVVGSRMALVTLMVVGAMVYIAALFALGGIKRSEVIFLYRVLKLHTVKDHGQ